MNNCVHRDLKLENILLDKHENVRTSALEKGIPLLTRNRSSSAISASRENTSATSSSRLSAGPSVTRPRKCSREKNTWHTVRDGSTFHTLPPRIPSDLLISPILSVLPCPSPNAAVTRILIYLQLWTSGLWASFYTPYWSGSYRLTRISRMRRDERYCPRNRDIRNILGKVCRWRDPSTLCDGGGEPVVG